MLSSEDIEAIASYIETLIKIEKLHQKNYNKKQLEVT